MDASEFLKTEGWRAVLHKKKKKKVNYVDQKRHLHMIVKKQ